MAVASFSGLATSGEVNRQLATLLASIGKDGLQRASLAGGLSYSLFQYNPPYTLPWLRRNDLAVPVVVVTEGAEAKAGGEAEAGGEVEAGSLEPGQEEFFVDGAWLDAPSD